MSTLSATTQIHYVSYDETGRRGRDGQTDTYDREYTPYLEEAYEAARAHRPLAKDAREFIGFTGGEPSFHHTKGAQWVDLPNFYGARVCFFYDEAFECLRGIQRTQSGMRHVYRIEVDTGATTYYHPVMKRDVPVPAAEARIVRWAWSSVPVAAGKNALNELRRRGATDEDPQWTVFPKEIHDALEAAYESGAPAPSVDVVLGAPLHIELGTSDLEGTRELGVFRCRNGSGNRFMVKRLRQTESHVLESSAQLQRRFEKICTKQQAEGKNTDDECCICMESIPSSPFDLLPCGHLGHRLCLQGCIIEGHGGTRIRCPMCREVGNPVG